MATFFSFVIYLQHFLAMMLRKSSFLIPLCMLLPALGTAAAPALLMLPNQEQLPSGHVLYVMQDDEGALWYATEGGGLCRDDGCAIDVFRNEASRPDLLGSNNVACLAQMRGCIIVGTFHGACVLDKADFSIRRLEEVDDKRVDDILVTRNGDLLLTANKKIYYFDRDLHLVATYDAHGKYVSHLFEDASGLLWATLWGGGLLRCSDGAFRQMPWPLDVAPTDLADAADGTLWVGTAGRGIVRYDPGSGTTHPQPEASMGVCTDLQASADGARLWASTMGGVRLFPCRRDGLAAGVGPRVAVVEVYHHAHAFGLGPEAHGHDLLFAAGAAAHRPHAQTYAVDALFLQNLEDVLLLVVLVEPLGAPALHGWHEADVGTKGKCLVGRTVEDGVRYGDGVCAHCPQQGHHKW